jgi:hypothetical protein
MILNCLQATLSKLQFIYRILLILKGIVVALKTQVAISLFLWLNKLPEKSI